MTTPLLGVGRVWHSRLRPCRNAFVYPVFFLMLPLRALRRDPSLLAIPRRRFGLLGFDDRDHGAGDADALAWAERLLVEQGIDDVDGEIWLQTFPRVLGYVFKPVSFWFCHRADGTLRAVLAEVNNTFGERHVYLLRPASDGSLVTDKVFHVSPFCAVAGSYRFRFRSAAIAPGARWTARIDHADADGPLLLTGITGGLQPLTRASAWRALLGQPLLTLGVTLRIHWQAWRLWRKRVPLFRKPPPPTAWIS